MPIKYFEIREYLRQQIPFLDSVVIKILKYGILYLVLGIFFSLNKSVEVPRKVVVLLLLMCIVYRYISLYEKINIKNCAIQFRREQILVPEQVELLSNDIESSLNKITNFANWSCGILATVSIFIVTTFFNLFKDKLYELIPLLSTDTIKISDIISVFEQPVLSLLIFLLGYYLTVQAFTYNKRFINSVLKSSLYVTDKDDPITGFGKIEFATKKLLSNF